MLAWAWETVKNQTGHGTAGAGEEVISFGRTSDSSFGVTKSIGNVRVFACSATMELFDIKLDDLEDVVDEVTGVATFIDRAKDADISMFI